MAFSYGVIRQITGYLSVYRQIKLRRIFPSFEGVLCRRAREYLTQKLRNPTILDDEPMNVPDLIEAELITEEVEAILPELTESDYMVLLVLYGGESPAWQLFMEYWYDNDTDVAFEKVRDDMVRLSQF